MVAQGKTHKQKNSTGHFDAIPNIEEVAPISVVPIAANEWVSIVLSAARKATQIMQPIKMDSAQVSNTAAEVFLRGMADLFRVSESSRMMIAYTESSSR